jgi:DNA-binding MarR family transcriptional regulator
MKLIPVPRKSRELLTALGRKGCSEICLIIMSQKDEPKNFSEVYYALVSQSRMAWATYSKQVNYLADHGFIEKSTKTIDNRKSIFLRLTTTGRELVKMYVVLLGKRLEDLEPERGSATSKADEE